MPSMLSKRLVTVGAAITAASLFVSITVAARAETIEVDEAIPKYAKKAGISGTLNSIGSDTLSNLMTFWTEGFARYYPSVAIQVQGPGSSTAPPALTEGTAQLGPMSRLMKPQELEAFERERGYEPTAVGVALDSLAVFVHKDNPVESLTLPEVDAIFSKTRRGGFESDIVTWGQTGVSTALGRRPISLYGRNSASGTYGFFKQVALYRGDFKDTVKEQPGSASVVSGVATDYAGIGYSGIGYRTSDVRMVPLAKRSGQPAFDPTYENVLAGKYPLGRMLYVYVDKPPSEPLDPMIAEFFRFVLSYEGQQIVVKDGYLPLPAPVVQRERAKFGATVASPGEG